MNEEVLKEVIIFLVEQLDDIAPYLANRTGAPQIKYNKKYAEIINDVFIESNNPDLRGDGAKKT